ncbi:MAG: WYL domain-containing protein [Deltaproteobacteria bacterium]|nr:WYL domain-containing protein [Deltaproteobacteria bacterium]
MKNAEDKLRPAEKILGLYTLLLQSHRPRSLQNLRKIFNCSTSTMLRVIDQLEASRYGKVIKTKRGRESYYELDKTNLKIPNARFTVEGISALWMCRDFCERLFPRDLWKAMETSLLQGYSLTEAESKDERPSFARRISWGIIDYSVLAEEQLLLFQALRTRTVCAFDYLRGERKEPGHFIYAPLELVAFRETLFLRGWLLSENYRPLFAEPSLLCLHRVRRVRLLTKSSRGVPPLPPLGDLGLGIIETKKFRASIRFLGASARWVRERIWSEDQSIDQRADGSIVLSLTVRNSYEALSWLLSFGREAQVLEPRWLRKLLAEEARRVWEFYRVGL